jgi:CRP-like cAMP-binding protein
MDDTMTGYAQLIRQADIFYQFTPEQINGVADFCKEYTYSSGEVIFPEGSRSDELYIIAQGEVEILVNPALVSDRPAQEFQPVHITTLRQGQSFGEIALVDRGLRSATARAAQTPTRVLILDKGQLISLCEADHTFGYRLMYNLAADLALKIRSTDLTIRAELLYTAKK